MPRGRLERTRLGAARTARVQPEENHGPRRRRGVHGATRYPTLDGDSPGGTAVPPSLAEVGSDLDVSRTPVPLAACVAPWLLAPTVRSLSTGPIE